MELRELMEFGQIVRSNGYGRVVEVDPYDPDEDVDRVEGFIVVPLDDGQMHDDNIDMASADLHEWELLRGFTGQYCYNGPVMHDSEYIGGYLEQFIRETPGYFVAVMIDGLDEDDEIVPVGWAVAHKA